MNILALDLATRTGWALYENGRIESGVQDFSKSRGESNGMLFLKFNRWIMEVGLLNPEPRQYIPNDPKVDLIVFEQAHHRGGAATEIGVGLMTRVLEFCVLWRIEHTAVHSATLKKWATGSGNAPKQAMIESAEVRLYELKRLDSRPTIKDDNEADAILLLGYALEKFGGTAWNAQAAAVAEAK